jgi:hypothetical protein
MEHAYWGWYLDPFTNEIVTGLGSTMYADHIYPDYLIRRLAGFDDLTPEQQDALLNAPFNFQPLPGSLNSSKGKKTYDEWTQAPNPKKGPGSKPEPFDPGYVKEMRAQTKLVILRLKAVIRRFKAQNAKAKAAKAGKPAKPAKKATK